MGHELDSRALGGAAGAMPYVRCTGCELRFYAAVAHSTSTACPGCELDMTPRSASRTPLRDALLAAATSSRVAPASPDRPAGHPLAPRAPATRFPR